MMKLDCINSTLGIVKCSTAFLRRIPQNFYSQARLFPETNQVRRCGDVTHWGSHLLMSMWYWWRSYIHTLPEKFILLSTNRADISFHGMILLIRSSHGSGGKWRHRFDDLGVHCKRYSWSGKENVWSNELVPWTFFIIHRSYIRNELSSRLFGRLGLFFLPLSF